MALGADGSRTTYGYDPAGQLVREFRTGANAANATFTYDPAGNRVLLLDAGQRTTTLYDVANEQVLDLQPTSRTTYLYDLAGNRTQMDAPAATTYYAWDAQNRMTRAEPVAGPVTLAYDGDGRRRSRQTPSATRLFVYDFEKVLQETDDTGLTQKQYASTEEQYGDLLSAYGDGQANYYAFDGLGSTDALLAPDGTASDKWAYRAFGLETQTQGTDDNRFTWVGKQGYYDDREEGLYFLRARYYDPATGRFLSVDPKGLAAGDANLYRYGFNDPINRTDPGGMDCAWYDAACQVRAAAQLAQAGAQAVGGFVQQEAQAAGGFVQQQAQAVGSLVGQEAQAAGVFAQQQALQGAVYAAQGAQQAGAAIQQGAQQVGAAAQQAAEAAARLAREAWDSQLKVLEQGLQSAEQIAAIVGKWTAEQVREGINYFLRQINVDPVKFWEVVGQFGDAINKLLGQGEEIALKLVHGTAKGVEGFFNNFAQYAKEGVFEWLFGGLDINWDLIPEKWDDLGGWLAFFADLVGLSWDRILKAAWEAFSPEIDTVLWLYDTIAGLIGKGWDGLVEWIKGLWDKIKPALDVQKIVREVVNSAVGAVVDLAIKQVGAWVLSLNPAGGIVKVLKAVWDVLRWVYDNLQRLLTLGASVVEGFKTLLSDGGEDAVADLVEHGLAQAFVPALDLIAKQFGLDVIPQKIREVVGKLVGIVPNEVKDLLLKLKAWIWDKIKALVGGLFGKTRWLAHGREHELWIDYNEGEVLTSGSPTVSVIDDRAGRAWRNWRRRRRTRRRWG